MNAAVGLYVVIRRSSEIGLFDLALLIWILSDNRTVKCLGEGHKLGHTINDISTNARRWKQKGAQRQQGRLKESHGRMHD